jgi:hypothetical protein
MVDSGSMNTPRLTIDMDRDGVLRRDDGNYETSNIVAASGMPAVDDLVCPSDTYITTPAGRIRAGCRIEPIPSG